MFNALIKNPFANTSSPPVERGSSVAAAEASLKGKELLRGKTHAKVNTLTAEVDAARLALVEAEHALGAQVVDDLDGADASQTMKQHVDRVRSLEVALEVAIQKAELAATEFQDAKRFVAIEKEVQAIAHLKTVAMKVDQILVALEHVVSDELSPAMKAAHAASEPGIHLNFLSVAQLEFERFVLRAGRTLIPKGHVPDRLMKYQKWSDSIPNPEEVRTRRR